MLLKYKEAEYLDKIEYLRSNGYTVNEVVIDNDDLETDEEGRVFSAEIQLPNSKYRSLN